MIQVKHGQIQEVAPQPKCGQKGTHKHYCAEVAQLQLMAVQAAANARQLLEDKQALTRQLDTLKKLYDEIEINYIRLKKERGD